MDLGLAGKVVLVAGGSRGLGRAVALAFAAEGARLSICARNPEALASTAAAIRERSGEDALAVRADIGRSAEVERWVEASRERFGGVDVLVCNGGRAPLGSWDEQQDDSSWQRVFEDIILSTVRMIRAVVPSMRQRGGGRILSIQGIAVQAPTPNLILSNAMRPGIVGLFKTLASELGGDNILLNVVCPGRLDTELLRERQVLRAEREGLPLERIVERQRQPIPLGRFGRVEELADLMVFLASERASYITGAVIPVDGGLLVTGHRS